MFCYDPSEQVFNLNNKIIGIDWGKNGDKAIQTSMIKDKVGTFTIVDIKELEKP